MVRLSCFSIVSLVTLHQVDALQMLLLLLIGPAAGGPALVAHEPPILVLAPLPWTGV